MKTNAKQCRGFTLVEILVVIAVIALLAAIIMAVFNRVSKNSLIQRAQSERDQLETAIEGYHANYGFYPPGSGLGLSTTSQLYYELRGTTMSGASFTTLDNSSTVSAILVASTFGVDGFMNCSQGSGENAHTARNFFTNLKSGQIARNSSGVCLLVTAVPSDASYQPLPGFTTTSGNANPWRYACPGVNNPNSYDLSLQMMIGGKIYLICNWTKNVQIQ